MPGRLQVPAATPLAAVERNEIADVVGDVAGPGAWPLSVCWRCRCSLRGCRPSPPPALVTMVLVSASGMLGASGVSYFPRRCPEAGGSFCAGPRRPSGPCAAGCPGCGLAVVCHRLLFPALPPNSPAHRGRSSRPATPATSLPQPLPQKKSTPGSPGKAVAAVAAPRRESRVVPAAVPPGGRVCPGRTRAPPPASAACPPMWCRGHARGRPGSAVSLDFCDDCKEPCLNSITVCGWVRC